MLKEKCVIITGSTRGIGYETAKLFLENGAKVALLGSRKETVDNAIRSLKELNQSFEVIGFYPDLTNEEEIRKVFDKVEEEFGKIDCLINNAGLSSSTKLEEYTKEEEDKIIDLNIKAVYLCSKVVVPKLKKTKGSIINTSSMVSINGQKSGCLYPMSKFAVNGLTKSLALELASFGIRVNAVAPGITETDMVRNLPENMIEPLINSIPLKRMGTPNDIANAFLFLASDMSSYITGEILHVDGSMR